jgi:TrbL/VirB6 plasmid conjugal transfer protein.
MGGGGIGSGSDKTAFKASEILASGLQLFMNMAHSAAKASFIDRLLLSVPAYLTLFCVTVMAANLLVLIVTATVLCYGGVFFYAFAGVEWTRDIAMNYLKSIIAVGVNIFGCLLIIHIANEIIESKISTYDPSTGQVVLTMQGLLIIVCAMIILMIISMRIPSMLAQIVSSPTGSVSPITSGMMAAATISSVGRIAGEFAVDRARDVSGGYNAMKAAVQHTGEKTVQNKDGLGTLAMQGNTVGYLTKFGMDVGKTLAGGIYENWRDKGRGVAKTIQQKTADLRKEAIEEAKMPGNRLLNSDAAKDAAIGAITGTYVSSVPADVSNYENRGEGGMISGAGATVPGLATQGGGSIGATAGAIASSAAISSGVESLPGTANMASLAGAANVNSGTVETGGGSAAVTGDFISQTAKGGEFTASEHTSGGGWDSNKANVSSDSAAGTPPPLPGAAETPPSDLDDKIHDTVDKLNNIKDTMGGS